MEKVLVTGATGFIGYELVHQLVAKGLRPRLHLHRTSRQPLMERFPADIITGDLSDPKAVTDITRGIDTIFHLGARAVFEEYALVRHSIVDGSLTLMRAARDSGVETFVYASSLLVYGGQDAPISHDTPPDPRCGYGQAKLDAEQALTESAGDVALGIVRLPHVYGARDLMFREVRRGRVIIPGTGRNIYAHLQVEDAARLLITMAERRWRGVSPVADMQNVSWSEFLEEIHRQYPHFRIYRAPQWLALAGTRLLSPFRRLRGFPSMYTPDAVRCWNMQQRVDAKQLWQELALQPLYPTYREGISSAMDECVPFRWIHSVSDRQTKSL